MINTKANHEWRVVLFDHFSTIRRTQPAVWCGMQDWSLEVRSLIRSIMIDSPLFIPWYTSGVARAGACVVLLFT